MCQFDYYQWEKCGHKSIEIVEYCNEVFWKAGMSARLTPCPEQNFNAFFVRIGSTLDGMDYGSCRWIGLSGYCKICQEEYGMSKAIPHRTFNDYGFLEGVGDLIGPIFAVKLAGPIPYPTPSESMQFSSTPNEYVTKEYLDKEIAKSPTPPHEATPTVGEDLLARRLRASLHLPYIFTPYINNTVATLISVEDQDIETLISIQNKDTPEEFLDKGRNTELRELYFPAKLQWYELNHGVKGTIEQWHSRGYHEGRMIEGVPSQYFWNHVGLTPADEEYMLDRLRTGIPLQIIWREKFKERGVHFQMFLQHGRKLEQHFEARAVRANSRMGEIQRELGARSQAADGIQPFGAYQQDCGSDMQPSQRPFQPNCNPFGQSLDDLIQQRLLQQQQRQDQLMQQMMQQQATLRQRMLQQQSMRQQPILHMLNQAQQLQMQHQVKSNQKAPAVTVKEVEAEESRGFVVTRDGIRGT